MVDKLTFIRLNPILRLTDPAKIPLMLRPKTSLRNLARQKGRNETEFAKRPINNPRPNHTLILTQSKMLVN